MNAAERQAIAVVRDAPVSRDSSRSLTGAERLTQVLDGLAEFGEGHLSFRGHEIADRVMAWGVNASLVRDDVSCSDTPRNDLGQRCVEVWVGNATVMVLATAVRQ